MIARLYAPDSPEAAPRLVTVDGNRIEVIRDVPARLVAGPGRPRHLEEIDLGHGRVSKMPKGGNARLVYANRFNDRDLELLLERRWCGLDRSGQLVVATPELAVVVTKPSGPHDQREPELSIPLLRGSVIEEGLVGVRGATTARLTQLLLESPGRTWRPTELAAVDAVAATATASRLLAELADLGLVSSQREPRAHFYTVLRPRLLANWLADRVRPPDPSVTLSCFVRARDPETLVAHLGLAIARLPYPAVLTGSAAASAEQASVTTSLVAAHIRVDPHQLLKRAADDLGLQLVSSGANVRLIKDVGRVGTAHPRVVAGVPLAGAVRTWLDIRNERRGADAAELYWDTVVAAAVGDRPSTRAQEAGGLGQHQVSGRQRNADHQGGAE